MIKFVCSQIFSLMGWRYSQNLPQGVRSFVIVGAPHTSNWDFVPAMTLVYRSGLNAKFVIKKEWLRFPLGLVLRPIGAIGIDRNKIKTGAVSSSTDLMAHLFEDNEDISLMIAPEGTRSATHEWKSGFWHIAHKANVPLALAFADYKTKRAGIGLVLHTSDFEKDMRTIMDFYRSIHPCQPDKFKLDHRYS
jgi:1-acyl-sn-glycerol-3-phosphate acyltransferase